MANWTKRKFESAPVTEYVPGPNFGILQASLSGAVILALDVSGSMSGDRIKEARKGCLQFIDEAIADKYLVGVTLWHHGIEAVSPIEKSAQQARRLISASSANGGNNIGPTFQDAHSRLMAQPAGDRVLAIFGDGDLGMSPEAARSAAKPLVDDGIRIITCGLGGASANALDVVSTENAGTPRSANSETIAASIAGMATGLVRKR